MSNNIQKILTGNNAFYNQATYVQTTQAEMASPKPLSKPTYIHNTESKVWRVVKEIFSILIFPIGLCRVIHALAGLAIVPSSLLTTLPAFIVKKRGYDPDRLNQVRQNIDLNTKWKFKRLSVEVDGYTIDATIMGKASTFGNGRWVLASNGNGEFYEQKFEDHEFQHILSKLHGNAIVFNYPGVGSSTGMPNRKTMAKAYRAMLNFLEDQNNGIGAKEIIGYGHSIGGGVQGDALLKHKLKDDVKYVFVKSRTFSDLSTTVTSLMNSKALGFLVKLFGWNISSVESSKKLQAPEIIIQTAAVTGYLDISDHPDAIIDDGVISSEASLAKKLIEDGDCAKENKYFMGIPEGHNDDFSDPTFLVKKINDMLAAQ